MLYLIKDFLHKLYFKFSQSKFVKWLFPVFIFCFVPNVFAFNLDSTTPLVYGNQTYAYNWTSSSSWTALSIYKSNGYDGGVYYTDPVTTGTNGISFGMFLNGMLLPNHYYRLTYVGLNQNATNCGSPASWDRQFRFGSGMSNDSLVSRTYSKLIGINNHVNVFIDDPDATYHITDACSYTFIFALSGNATFMNLPFNTTSSSNSQWNFYGYYLEDIGSTDTVTNSQLQTTITNIQNSINNNISTEFDDLKDLDHTYNNNPKDTPSGQSDIDNTLSKENQLRNNLNLDSSSVIVTLNTNATTYIWGIINRIRAVDSRIVLLFTTVLSLGIIKMILNR